MQPTTVLNQMYNELVTVLQGVMDPNNATSPLFQNTDSTWNIYDGPQQDYTGTPAAVLIPSDGPKSTFQSNYMNKRGYGYYIFIVMDTELSGYATTRANMRLITDGVLDSLDRSDMLNNVVDILEASTFKWIEEEGSKGVEIIAPLEVSAFKLVQTATS